MRAAISCALGCPYQGEVSIDAVDDVVARLLGIRLDNISIEPAMRALEEQAAAEAVVAAPAPGAAR